MHSLWEKCLISPVSQAKHKCPDVRAEDDDYSVDDDQAGKEAQEEKPEPDEDVDLFVDCNRVSLCLNTCGREIESWSIMMIITVTD